MKRQCFNILQLVVVLRCMSLPNAHAQSSDEQKLPDYIAPCYRDDPMLSECIKSTMDGVIRKLVDGIPELNVPPIEPLYKDEIEAINVAGFRLKIKDITLWGTSKVYFVWTSASTKTKIYDFKGKIDLLEIDANYELTGFMLPMHSTGTVNIIARNFEFHVDAIVDKVNKDGVDFVKISDVRMKDYVPEASMWISNLGPFEVAINQLLNHRVNMRFILNHITPIIEDVVTKIMQKFINRIFNTVPYDIFLPKGTGPAQADIMEPHKVESVSG